MPKNHGPNKKRRRSVSSSDDDEAEKSPEPTSSKQPRKQLTAHRYNLRSRSENQCTQGITDPTSSGSALVEQVSRLATNLSKLETKFQAQLVKFAKFESSLPKFTTPSEPAASSDGISIKPQEIEYGLCLANVGGLNDQVQWLKDNLLEGILRKKECETWGYKPEKGIIFYGPPGCGKTLLAQAFVGELNKLQGRNKFTFFMRKGADLLDQYVGNSEKSIRDLFAAASASKPAIVFFDEIDGLCTSRQRQHEQVYTTIISTILAEMDQIKRGEIFIIGATNRIEALDPALRRPGRFGTELHFTPPNEGGRLEILKIHTVKWRNPPSSQLLYSIAQKAVGFTGADLEQLVRHAFDAAKKRVRDGTKSDILSPVQILSLNILEEDWMQALGKINKTNINVFGNNSFQGTKLCNELEPLLDGISEELSNQLAKFCTSRVQQLTNKFLVFWTENEYTLLELNTHIIPHILCSQNDPDVSVFQLNYQQLASSTQPLLDLQDLFTQIRSCGKRTSILLIKNFHKFCAELPTCLLDAFQSHFKEHVGKQQTIILLGSANCELTQFPPEVNWITHGGVSVQLRETTEVEHDNFLKPLFDTTSKAFEGYQMSRFSQGRLARGHQKLVRSCKGKSITEMIQVYGKLAACFNSDDSKELIQNLEKTIQDIVQI